MKVGDVVEIAVPSLESQWLHGLEVGQRVRVHQVFEDEPRRMTVEVGGELRMVLPSEVREVLTFAVRPEAVEAGLAAYMDGNADDLGGLIGNVIAAALPHILGEPVAWREVANYPDTAPQPAPAQDCERDRDTGRRRAAVETLLSAGWNWQGGKWIAPAQGVVTDAVRGLAAKWPQDRHPDPHSDPWTIGYLRAKRECASELEAALAAEQASVQAKVPEWQPIETLPLEQGWRTVVALISVNGPNGYITDPWTGWAEGNGKFARWPHPFPPTHWMPLPAAPSPKVEG